MERKEEGVDKTEKKKEGEKDEEDVERKEGREWGGCLSFL